MDRRPAFRPQAPDLAVHRLRAGRWSEVQDRVAAEEPLQILLDGEPLSVVMRTPGADVELTLGLLHAEGVLARLEDVRFARISAETAEDEPAGGLEVRGELLASNAVDVVRERPGPRPVQRSFVVSSACGVCGAVTVDELAAEWPPVAAGPTMPFSILGSLPARLREAQRLFERTGGLHAAGLFDASGSLLLAREDIGRHNAVDKIVGRLFLHRALPAADRLLVVSGRAGFEIVQKAVAAGLPIVVAVGAPSSLAVATARRFGVTLVGFTRPDAANVYAGSERVLGA
ncbi:MAG: formate dehydrogenase accessory sulfurtransferase FdhD [Candidatus Dormiibacterota bacterium]